MRANEMIKIEQNRNVMFFGTIGEKHTREPFRGVLKSSTRDLYEKKNGIYTYSTGMHYFFKFFF